MVQHWAGLWIVFTNMAQPSCILLVSSQAVKKLGLDCRIGHLDSTSFHSDGRYNNEDEEVEDRVIRITKGYSRDHRPDLNQIGLQLICENQAGIPVLMESLSGSSVDKDRFRLCLC